MAQSYFNSVYRATMRTTLQSLINVRALQYKSALKQYQLAIASNDAAGIELARKTIRQANDDYKRACSLRRMG